MRSTLHFLGFVALVLGAGIALFDARAAYVGAVCVVVGAVLLCVTYQPGVHGPGRG